MPVVRTSLSRLSKMVGANGDRVIERIPYVGLDIESVQKDELRVEYSPNRPDFGTDFGIARALRGLLGKEVGLPRFKVESSGITVEVDRALTPVRPYIACASVEGLRLGEEDVRQVISLQEDLHNGLGRHRKISAIGLHDLDAIRPPIRYHGAPGSFKFVPLGKANKVSIDGIIKNTEEGRAYGRLFGRSRIFPVLSDSIGTVLSFPPVINGNATKVTTKTHRMFIDVTGTERSTCEDVLAVITTTLAEAGGQIGSVKVAYLSGTRTTPILTPSEIPLDLALIRSVLGIDLRRSEAVSCLRRSRLGVRGNTVLAPRYRIDLLHRVDVAEEVALGYGVDHLRPEYPASKQPGSFDSFEVFLDSVSTVMAGSGMIELMTFELIDERTLFANFGRDGEDRIVVQDPKSLEHSVLRDALIPSLMGALSGNVKSDYPQRVFEIGRVYARGPGGVRESWHLGCLIAHSQASFSEAKMYLEAVCRLISGREVRTREGEHWSMADGRAARALLAGKDLGWVGELKPAAVDSFGLRVPVAGFELDLPGLEESLK